MDVILTVGSTCSHRAAVRFLSFPRAGMGMGKKNGNPDLVCEKKKLICISRLQSNSESFKRINQRKYMS